MTTLEKTLSQTHDWAIDRMYQLYENENYGDASSIQSEFSEWLNPDILEHDIYSLNFIGE